MYRQAQWAIKHACVCVCVDYVSVACLIGSVFQRAYLTVMGTLKMLRSADGLDSEQLVEAA